MVEPPSIAPERAAQNKADIFNVYKRLKMWRVKQMARRRHNSQFVFLILLGWPQFVLFLFYILLWQMVERSVGMILSVVLPLGVLVGIFLYDLNQSKRQKVRFLWIPWTVAILAMIGAFATVLIWNYRFSVQSHRLSDAVGNYVAEKNNLENTNIYWSNRVASVSKAMRERENPIFRFNLLADWAWFDFTNADYSKAADMYRESFEAQAAVRQTNFYWTLSPIYEACILISNPTAEKCEHFTNFVNELTRENWTRGYDICKGQESALRSIRPMMPTNTWPFLDRNIDQLFYLTFTNRPHK